ncbi:hypothetical protein ACERII_19355 [Evansella sp. AB-rgal1]|uniref:hypothetical protein n=1 Tax=Evansella sp. AB-rgal1 TaxID=3242696 RepID=UPI00359D4ED6
MKKKHFLLVMLCISLFLCGIVLFYYSKENRGISKEEAESIALKQAESDGFLSPTLWERLNSAL